MQPSQTLANRFPALLAADATTFNSATANKVHLASAAFTPSLSLALGTLTEATFVGYAALLCGIGAAQNFFDPATGNMIVQLLEPAGGWHWTATSATGLPQTIYGYYLTDNGTANLFASALLPAPVVLNAINQGLDIAQVRVTIPANPAF